MLGRFVVLDLTALYKFPSNIEPSTRKRKKLMRKKVNREIEDRGDQNTKKTTPIPHILEAQLAFALYLFPLLLLFYYKIIPLQMCR